jgi:hypothetical protein
MRIDDHRQIDGAFFGWPGEVEASDCEGINGIFQAFGGSYNIPIFKEAI